MKPREVWQVTFTLIAGGILGAALVSLDVSDSTDLIWLFALVVLAGLVRWFEIPLDPYDSFNLSTIVYVLAAASYGTWHGVVVALLAPPVGTTIYRLLGARSAPLALAVSTGGEAALSLGVAGSLLGLISRQDDAQFLYLLALSASIILLTFVLSAIRVSIAEGIALGRLLRPFARRALPHLAAIFAAVPVVWLAFDLIGPIGIFLSMIVMVETYRPWKLLGEQRALFLKSLQMMSNAVDLKDPYTAHHSRRVAEYSVKLARSLYAPEEEVERIRIGALMHDIGKIAVPGHLIRKPSKLTDQEMELMKTHVDAGAELIGDLEILKESTDIVLHSHENFDGSGYPSGLSGESIPLGSRIVFVVDAFDALTTDRPYRKGRSYEEAMKELRANASRQFDRRVLEAFGDLTGIKQ